MTEAWRLRMCRYHHDETAKEPCDGCMNYPALDRRVSGPPPRSRDGWVHYSDGTRGPERRTR